jgi:hypothetical protein
MSEQDGRTDWPLLMGPEVAGMPSDERAEGVYLLEADYSVDGEGTKRTAQFCTSPHGDYWLVCDWEQINAGGVAHWLDQSSFTVSLALLAQLQAIEVKP